MSGAPDAIVIGGGHDGLVAAATLAQAGRSVVLCEARPFLGGRCAREEFHPGYSSPGLLHDTSGLRPQVVESLGLVHHGLQRLPKEAPVFSPAEQGPNLWRLPDPGEMVAALRAVCEADAWAWRRFGEQIERLSPLLGRVFDAEAPDPEPGGLSGAWELLRLGLDLRRLGPRDLRELLRIGPMAVRDWLTEQFQTDRLRALLALPAVAGTWAGPWSAGSAARLLIQEATRAGPVRGGPAALIDALESAATQAGVELLLDARVTSLATQAGRVEGVTLSDGRELQAPCVLSSLEPRATLLGLAPRRSLPAPLGQRLRHWRVRGTTACLRLALEGPVPWRRDDGRPVIHARLADGLPAIEAAFDAVKYGRFSERPVLELAVPSLDDPRLAPEGGTVLTALVSYAPYELRGGWTDRARAALRAAILSQLERHAPGIEQRVVGEQLLVPPDLEQRYGLTGGQLHHGEPALDQCLHLRPDPELSRGATPLDGLFLCGAGRHPGGDLNGMAGLLAARAVLARRDA